MTFPKSSANPSTHLIPTLHITLALHQNTLPIFPSLLTHPISYHPSTNPKPPDHTSSPHPQQFSTLCLEVGLLFGNRIFLVLWSLRRHSRRRCWHLGGLGRVLSRVWMVGWGCLCSMCLWCSWYQLHQYPYPRHHPLTSAAPSFNTDPDPYPDPDSCIDVTRSTGNDLQNPFHKPRQQFCHPPFSPKLLRQPIPYLGTLSTNLIHIVAL